MKTFYEKKDIDGTGEPVKHINNEERAAYWGLDLSDYTVFFVDLTKLIDKILEK